MNPAINELTTSDRRRRGWGARAFALLGLLLLASCGGQTADFFRDLDFYSHTQIVVSPGAALINPGEDAPASVTVMYLPDANYPFRDATVVGTPGPGTPAAPVTAALTFVREEPCTAAEQPAGEPQLSCRRYALNVHTETTATSVGTITLSAIWQGNGILFAAPAPIERLGAFAVSFPPRPEVPDFGVEVIGVGPTDPPIYATRALDLVQITRVGGFADPVALSFDAMGSGIDGTFTCEPTERCRLDLHLPAIYAAGGAPRLRVTATSGTVQRSVQFVQRIAPLFAVTLSPSTGTLTSGTSLDIGVVVGVDPSSPFHTLGLGRVDLATPDLPPGVTAIWVPDAQPRLTAAAPTAERTLRLFSDGQVQLEVSQQVRGTAIDHSPDPVGELPSIQGTLTLNVAEGKLWDFVDRGASYNLTENDAIGIALQRTGANLNQPAIAWLEGRPGSRSVYLKRFDGATFNAFPTPGLGNGLAPTTGLSFEEARMAMTASDIAQVAITVSAGAREGAQVVLGSLGAGWSSTVVYSAPFNMHARSPRIAAGVGEAYALAYLVETDPAVSAGQLFVHGTTVGGLPVPLPGPHAGAINAAPDGRVLRDATAIALRGDGNPWVAWIEQPLVGSARLWLRGWDGAAWGPVLGVPTPRTPVAGSLQLLVDGAGQLVIAWLQSSPAKLKVARLDPASLTWTFLDTARADGSLNIADDQGVHDVSLALDSSGRLVAAWTEGGSAPSLWAMRLEAGTGWGLLGTAISVKPSKSPFIVSDSNGNLFTEYTQYLRLGQDLSSGHVDTDVFVARWRFQ
ncbi:MAG: hypothetical protein ABI520_08495 [Caldimonas sp.]